MKQEVVKQPNWRNIFFEDGFAVVEQLGALQPRRVAAMSVAKELQMKLVVM